MFNTNDFIFTSETTPDVTTDLTSCVQQVEELIGVADSVNVTDSPNCKSRLNSLLVASEIKRSGLDVILQLTAETEIRLPWSQFCLERCQLELIKSYA